ncbi:MAG: dephospho-CoA kinase [Desulfovibrio sp.]|nr:dephospho-CoA kinase [Desulfovibrio sp.]
MPSTRRSSPACPDPNLPSPSACAAGELDGDLDGELDGQDGAPRLCFEAGPADAGRRLDQTLMRTLEATPSLAGAWSREAVKKAVREGRCRVDGRPQDSPSAKVRQGACIEFVPGPGRDACTLEPEEGAVDLRYADSALCVVAKPAGLTVHPCPSCPSGTLVQRLAFRFPQMLAMEGLRPGIVHRIDKDTSGLLCCALTEKARLALSQAFAERRVHKEYLALVAGRLPDEGAVDEPLGRDPQSKVRMAVVPESQGGRSAHTRWRRLWTSPDGSASLACVRILTGRTHQIRVHMASIGHPLLGDQTYAPAAVAAMAPRQMLHAWRLALQHPETGRELAFACPPPQDFQETCLARGKLPQCLVITGNPGSGKSTVAGLLRRLHVPGISADELVAGYYAKGGELASWLAQRLGPDILADDGAVSRNALMQAFDQSPDLRAETEKLAHAMVKGDIQDFFARAVREGWPRVLAEIPLYFECGWHKSAFSPEPLAVGVQAGLEAREARLARDRGWSRDKARAIEGWQWPEERKMAACDLVVENRGNPADLEAAVTGTLLPALERLKAQEEAELAARLKDMWEKG